MYMRTCVCVFMYDKSKTQNLQSPLMNLSCHIVYDFGFRRSEVKAILLESAFVSAYLVTLKY